MRHRHITRLIALAVIALAPLGALAGNATDSLPSWWKFVPHFSGTFRAFYQYSPSTHQSRFEVADARLVLNGYVFPWVDYFLQVNFDSQGKVSILDAFGRFYPDKDKRVALYIGQMRVPISYAACELPWKYHFTELMLTARLVALRSVGVKGGYTVPGSTLYVEGGLFNATDMADHKAWNSALTYAVKSNIRFCGFTPEIGFMSRTPGGYGAGARCNSFDASVEWKSGNWFAEAEYVYTHYTHHTHKAAQAYGVMGEYTFRPDWRVVNHWSVEGRFDGITDASDGRFNSEGRLATSIFSHRRVTIGTTLGYLTPKGLKVDFRINYEHCFYSDKDAPASITDRSKLTAGAIFHF